MNIDRIKPSGFNVISRVGSPTVGLHTMNSKKHGPDAFSERDLADLFDLSDHGDVTMNNGEPHQYQREEYNSKFPFLTNTALLQRDDYGQPGTYAQEASEAEEDPLMRKVWSPERDNRYFDSSTARQFDIAPPSIFDNATHVIPTNTLSHVSITSNVNIGSYSNDALDRAETHCVFQARHRATNNNLGYERAPIFDKACGMNDFIRKPVAHRRYGSFSSSTLDDLNLITSESKIVTDHQAKNVCNLIDAFALETKKRKREMEGSNEDNYVEPRDEDVLLGRGGRANKHPGNERYHHEKIKLQPKYKAATKEDKTDISQELVDVVHAYGGRFLKLDENADKWYEVANIVARRKASQALREENTPEKRAAKRAKYPAKSRAKSALKAN